MAVAAVTRAGNQFIRRTTIRMVDGTTYSATLKGGKLIADTPWGKNCVIKCGNLMRRGGGVLTDKASKQTGLEIFLENLAQIFDPKNTVDLSYETLPRYRKLLGK